MLQLHLHDTAGENFSDSKVFEMELKNTDAFILVYSVTDPASFNAVKRLHKFLKMLRSSNNPSAGQQQTDIFIVVGNKTDLQHLRCVPAEETKQWCHNIGGFHTEISVAEDYLGTNKLFADIMRHVLTKKSAEDAAAGNQRRNNYSTLLKVSGKTTETDINCLAANFMG
jgi:GTPase SAR1 and related small G proteins